MREPFEKWPDSSVPYWKPLFDAITPGTTNSIDFVIKFKHNYEGYSF